MLRIKAARLIAAAIESGMTERKICTRSNVAHETFSKMKRGEMVQFPSIKRICNTLDLKPAEILEDIHETLQTERPQEPVRALQGQAEQP